MKAIKRNADLSRMPQIQKRTADYANYADYADTKANADFKI